MHSDNVTTGKLSPEALKRSVLSYGGFHRPELLVGPAVGEDAAVIEWQAGKYLVFSSDPVVGAERGAGRLLVRVNSNDIASKGGDPAYLAVTLIIPPHLGEERAAAIMSEIHEECAAQGIAIAGGHTELNGRYQHPVIMGALIGMADRVLRASDLEPGDVLIVTKHVGIEGMSILAMDRPDLLENFLTKEETAEIASWTDKTSVLQESRTIRHLVKFMHDPTEGGFKGGVDEISVLSGLSAIIDRDAVPVHPLTKLAAERLGFDPLSLIASGSLLIALSPEQADEACLLLEKAGIEAMVVGHMGEALTEPVPDPKEELWGLLNKEAHR